MTAALRTASIATLVTQIVIVGTGGAVRLTGSGLGCSTWPNCIEGSFVPTPELGIHGIIEFANRVMGGITVAVAFWVLVLAIVHRRRHPGVLWLAVAVFALTIAQALIGAVVVWMHLRPDTVGVHFVLSAVLVGLATWLVWRVLVGRGDRWGGTATQRWLMAATGLALAIVVELGILTTGSGPHAGDGGAARNGLAPQVMQHVHAIPGYVLFAVSVALAAFAWVRGPGRHRFFALALVAIETVQIIIGVVQSNTGLPVGLVGAHMVLSVLAIAAATAAALALRRPKTAS